MIIETVAGDCPNCGLPQSVRIENHNPQEALESKEEVHPSAFMCAECVDLMPVEYFMQPLREENLR